MPDKLDLQPILESYHGNIYAVVERGWRRWSDLPGNDRRAFSLARTRACCVWGYMSEEADVEFAGIPEVRRVDDPTTCQFIIENAVLIRFKKLDEDGYSRNFPTSRACAFNGQYDLPGIPAHLQRVDVGYVENAFGNGFTCVKLSYREGDTVRWWYDIQPTALPLLLPQEDEPQRRSRIKRRGMEQQSFLADTGSSTKGGEE